MKTLIASVALGFAVAMAPAIAADAPAQPPKAPAKAMKFTGKPSMLVKGRFHELHEKQEKLECKDCHNKVQKDILYLRKDDKMPPEMDKVGQVDRKGCLTCHKPGYIPNLPRSYWGV
jgi:hypothetical protein